MVRNIEAGTSLGREVYTLLWGRTPPPRRAPRSQAGLGMPTLKDRPPELLKPACNGKLHAAPGK